MCALSHPAVIQTCLSSSATPILIRPEELKIGLLGNMDRRFRNGQSKSEPESN